MCCILCIMAANITAINVSFLCNVCVVLCCVYIDIYLSSGQIPSELGNLTKLTSLHLGGNSLTGMCMYMNILTIYR